MIDLNQTWIGIECPKCGYQDEIQMIDVRTERTIICHNCKVSIKLIDNESSTHTGLENVNQAFKDLEKTLKNFGK